MPDDELTTSAIAMRAVADSLRAYADGDEETVLRIVNSLDHGQAVTAAGYALACLREAVEQSVNRDPRRIELALRNAAEGIEQDLITHQVRLMTREQGDLE